MKFGADMNTARYLIDKAREIDLEVTGVRYEILIKSIISILFYLVFIVVVDR